jgi:cell division protein FtsW
LRLKVGVHKKTLDSVLFFIVLSLLVIGLIFVFSASSWICEYDPKINNAAYYLEKQLVWAGFGFIAMIIMTHYDYHNLKKISKFLIIVTIFLLLAVFLFPETKGAKRWIYIGSLSMQPSEIAKYVVVAYLAESLSRNSKKATSNFIKDTVPYLIIAAVFSILILKEPNMSIASIIIIVTFIMMLASGIPVRYIVSWFGLATPMAIFLMLTKAYRLRRVMSFLNPWADSTGDSFQLIQSLIAIGSGGWSGLGLGQSRQKTYYIPEPHNDFIFSIIAEEIGLIGCVLIIILFILFLWRGLRIASRANDKYGYLLAIGITCIITIQAIINIAVVTGSMPVTGVPLPFISYGGTSLVINMASIGVLLNISKQVRNNVN